MWTVLTPFLLSSWSRDAPVKEKLWILPCTKIMLSNIDVREHEFPLRIGPPTSFLFHDSGPDALSSSLSGILNTQYADFCI
jgi:hypothetical protein